MKKIFAYSTTIATLTAAMALGSVSYAATGTPAGVSADASQTSATVDANHAKDRMHKKGHRHHRRHGHHHMHGAAMLVPGYGPLNQKFVDTLALTDAQLKLVQAAKDEQKAGRDERREAMKLAYKDRFEQLKAGKLDPQAALKQKDESLQKAQARHRNIEEKWLAVWSGLDTAQQQKVAAHFSDRAEKFAKRLEERKARKEKRAAEQASS